MIKELLVNAALLVAMVSIGHQIYLRMGNVLYHTIGLRLALGVICGAFGSVLMLESVQISPTVILDFRGIPFIGAFLYGGVLPGFLAGLIITAFRMAYFGISVTSLIAAGVILVAGSGIVTVSRLNLSHTKRWSYSVFIYLLTVSVAFVLTVRDPGRLLISLLLFWAGTVTMAGGLFWYVRFLWNLTIKSQKYGTIVRTAPDGFCIISSANGRLLDANEAFCRMLGYSRDELCAKLLRDIREDESVDDVLSTFPIREAHYTTRVESRYRRRDGRLIHLEISTSFASEDEHCIYLFVRDVTARKCIEQEREHLYRELERKNEELEQILYVTSHDLRSPLVNVQGFTRELQYALQNGTDGSNDLEAVPDGKGEEREGSRADVARSLQFIQLSVDKMDSLLSGILKVSRIGRVQPEIFAVDMNALLSSVLRSLEFQLREIQVEVSVSELPVCSGDPILLNQLFTNLLDNAIKYRDPNIPLRVRVEGKIETGEAIYSVEDNGIGIRKEHQEKIFQLFYRLDKRKAPGEGLGLTIVQRIVNLHGGRIEVESEEGRGCRFVVAIPVLSESNTATLPLVGSAGERRI